VPGLGHVALFLQTRGGLAVAGAVALVVLAVFVLDPARMAGRVEGDGRGGVDPDRDDPDRDDPDRDDPATRRPGGATGS